MFTSQISNIIIKTLKKKQIHNFRQLITNSNNIYNKNQKIILSLPIIKSHLTYLEVMTPNLGTVGLERKKNIFYYLPAIKVKG